MAVYSALGSVHVAWQLLERLATYIGAPTTKMYEAPDSSRLQG